MTKFVAPKLVPRVLPEEPGLILNTFRLAFCNAPRRTAGDTPAPWCQCVARLILFTTYANRTCVCVHICMYIYICDCIWKFACNTKYFGAAVCSWFYENKSKQSNRISCIWQTSYMFKTTHIVTHHMFHYRKQDLVDGVIIPSFCTCNLNLSSHIKRNNNTTCRVLHSLCFTA